MADQDDSEHHAGETTAMKASDLAEMLATTSIDELQTVEYRQILDTVDRLRTCGLGSILPLPQLVVCGNQSSGKSSVLEAITEVPFPRSESMCTRFATEIILRRDNTESLRTEIIPDETRTEGEKAKLKAFSETITDFNQLPRLIDQATDLMGLNGATDSSTTIAFTRDVLRVEIAGPGRPQLTLVDLPGLVLSANKRQTEADVALIHSLVNDYISEKRTIMLAVISAKNDYANQGILTKCKDVDRDGHRTLGIIPNPDYLKPSSANESLWINLAQNKDIYFQLGWHMLKNRSEDEIDSSFEQRNASEQAFFGAGQYTFLAAGDKGISTLLNKLSKLLFKHLKKELPTLQADLNSEYAKTMEALELLGDKRSTIAEQKRFLMSAATSYHAIVTSAVDGHYESPFFRLIDTVTGLDVPTNMRRLRAAAQHINLKFASQMRQYGHKLRMWAGDGYAGTNSKNDLPEPPLEDYQYAKDLQKVMSRFEAIQWVKCVLVRTRGRELPGNFNPLLMSQLFWEQSENWERLARDHIDRVDALCKSFVRDAIDDIVVNDVSVRLQSLKLNNALKSRRNRASEELYRLVQDKQRPPITYDPAYTVTIQEARAQKTTAKIQALMDKAKASIESKDGEEEQQSYVNTEMLKSQLKELIEPDMDKTSAEDALDSQLAYYQDRVKYFIAAVTDQVIERHLLHDLAQDTFSPMVVNDMSDQEIRYIAAEAEELTQKREFLEGHKANLEDGQEAFREALGSFK